MESRTTSGAALMGDVDLWTFDDPSTRRVTFTDEYGNTLTEFEARHEDADRVARGPSAHNALQLDRHTGTPRWAARGGDVPALDAFEPNLANNPTERFVSDRRRRAHVQLDLNRNGTQAETRRENFQPRDAALYSGYNALAAGARGTLRHFVPTRRSEQEMDVVGAERVGEPRAALEGEREEPRRAGAHRKETDATRGRASHREERAGRHSLLPMSAWQGLHSLAPNDRVSDPTGRGAMRGDARLSRWDSVPSENVAKRVALHDHPWGQARRRAEKEVTLSAHDSQVGGGIRATRADTPRVPLAPEDTVLGTSDSAAARAPQPSTFSDAARAAAVLVLGTRDARPRSADALVKTYPVTERPLPSAVAAPRNLGPVAGRAGWHDYVGEHRRALEGARARPLAADSQRVERVVADAMEQRARLVAAEARRFREDPAAGRVGPRTHETGAGAVPSDDVRLGGSDAALLAAERRERIAAHARPFESTANGRPWNSTSTIPARPATHASTDVAQPPVRARPQRAWGDDGSVAQRSAPLGAGPSKPFALVVDGGTAFGTQRRAVAGTVGPASYPHVRAVDAVPYLSTEEGIRV